jgi:streptogramin lyase
MARFNQTLHVTAILVVQTIQVAAQPTVRFDQIGLNQGLSQSTILAIVQDKQGFLWFGTQDGLNRYDGYTMKVFKHDPADSNSISDNVIWTLLCDSRGDLWIGTERGGLNRYVQAENKFYRYMRNGNDTNSLAENTVTLLYEDSRGTIWVGTRHKGLSVLNTSTGTFSRLRFDSGDLTISDGPMIREICEDKKRNLWVAMRGHGLYVLALNSVNTSRITRYSHKATDPHSLSSDDVRALCYDRQGTLWVGRWTQPLQTKRTHGALYTLCTRCEEPEIHLEQYGHVNP